MLQSVPPGLPTRSRVKLLVLGLHSEALIVLSLSRNAEVGCRRVRQRAAVLSCSS